MQLCFSFTRYNIKNDVREAMYEEAETWMKAVGKRKFMGGSAPNLADLVSCSICILSYYNIQLGIIYRLLCRSNRSFNICPPPGIPRHSNPLPFPRGGKFYPYTYEVGTFNSGLNFMPCVPPVIESGLINKR